jgi:Accessory gene regulator B.
MIEKIAVSLTRSMVEAGIIQQEQQDSYVYAIVTFIERIIVMGAVLLIAVLQKNILPTIVFWISFMELRKRTNGYHANSFLKCFLGTVGIYFLVIAVTPLLLRYLFVMYALLIAAIICIEIIGTINHPNMNLSLEEYVDLKKTAQWFALLELFCIGIFIILDANMIYIGYMSISIILCAILLCIGKILKQELKMDI